MGYAGTNGTVLTPAEFGEAVQALCAALNEAYGNQFTASPCTFGTSLIITGTQVWNDAKGRADADEALKKALTGLVVEEKMPKSFVLCGKDGMRSTTVIPIRDFIDQGADATKLSTVQEMLSNGKTARAPLSI